MALVPANTPWHLTSPRHSLRRLPLGKPLRLPFLAIHLRQPLARLHELYDVDDLLRRHYGEADASEHPRDERVHLVRARELERRRAVGIGEDLAEERGVDLRTRVEISGAGGADRVEERGGEKRGREGEKVEGDEEELVRGAEDEEDGLRKCQQARTRQYDRSRGWMNKPTLFV